MVSRPKKIVICCVRVVDADPIEGSTTGLCLGCDCELLVSPKSIEIMSTNAVGLLCLNCNIVMIEECGPPIATITSSEYLEREGK